MRDLTRGPIPGHIAAMALPIAVGMTVQTLYYLVDLYFVSRLGGPALAGVSAAGNAMFLVMALTQTLSVGVVALVSHAVGAKDQPRANQVFNQGVLLAAILATVVLVGGYFGLADAYIGTIGADAETVAAGATYLHWFLPGMALMFASTAMGSALQGTGIVKPTMMVQMLTVLVNIILTPIMVAGWGTGRPLGVVGAALSSTIAVTVGVILMAIYFVRLETYIHFDLAKLRPQLDVLKRMLGIGMPAGGELALMFVYMAVIYAVISGFGAAAQAGFGVAVRVTQAVFLPAMAVSFATPAIAGQNFGARNADRVRETFRAATLMNVVVMSLLTLLCQLRPEWLVKSFSSDAEVLSVAVGLLTIVSWSFVASGLTFTCSGMFQALGNTLPGLAAIATRLVTFVGPAFWLARQPGFKLQHVWYLSVATLTLQAVLSFTLARWLMARKLQRLEPVLAEAGALGPVGGG